MENIQMDKFTAMDILSLSPAFFAHHSREEREVLAENYAQEWLEIDAENIKKRQINKMN
ncbi:MAG: hypothetical protein WAV16_02990 [Candidatus Moraniibacteriota bacterium]